jgi:hypothetical protein
VRRVTGDVADEARLGIDAGLTVVLVSCGRTPLETFVSRSESWSFTALVSEGEHLPPPG